jgi:(R,R)-butanediol dehydrogenase/meso-butanediol dehydrogenase/diacetyl reductase
MRAAVYHGPGDIRLEERPEPAIGDGELLIEVLAAGICGTDVGEYRHDPMFFPVEERHPVTGHRGPTIPGHEFSGRVAGVAADVAGFSVGDLVTCGAGVSCGECPPCLAGRTNMCLRYWTVGLRRDGALAELVAVPAGCCLNLVGRSITPDVAALAQPLSIAVHGTRRGGLEADDVAVVLGAGGIGTFITHAAASRGARVVAVDLDAGRLETAAAVGASATVRAERGADLAALVGDTVPKPSIVFECTATEPVLAAALELVADNGRVVVVGHQPRPATLNFKLLTFGEKTLIGTMAHVFSADFPTAVDLLESGGEQWRSVAPTVYPLDELLTSGIEPMASGTQSQIKTLFSPHTRAARPLEVRA